MSGSRDRAAFRRRAHRGEGRAHQCRARCAAAPHRRDHAQERAAGARRASASGTQRFDAREHKAAFDAYMRSGESAGLRALEVKAMSVGSNPDGGYLVPVEIEHAIGQRLAAISPIRSIAGVRTISGNVYKKPFMTAGPATGWVGETDARTQTTSPTLDELSFPAMELYAMPAATATLLDDSAVNIDEWIAAGGGAGLRRAGGHRLRHRRRLQQAEGVPRLHHGRQRLVGLGQDRLCADRRRRRLRRRANPSDELVDLIYALKAGYRQNGVFVMNRKTQAAIRKFKDSGGGYLWQPPAVAGGRATLDDLPGDRGRGHAGRRREFATRWRSAISAAAT